LEMGLLWGTVAFLLTGAAVIIALELRDSCRETRVIVLFLENSEEISEAVLRRMHFLLRQSGGKTGILVVDNYSRDATVPIVMRMAAMFPEITLVTRSNKQEIPPVQLKKLLQNAAGVLDLRDASGLWATPQVA